MLFIVFNLIKWFNYYNLLCCFEKNLGLSFKINICLKLGKLLFIDVLYNYFVLEI